MRPPPSLTDVRKLLTAHVEESRGLPESTRVRDLGTERAVWRDYDGRIVHELLQNALDRADKAIHIRWVEEGATGTLIVANDGLEVSAFPQPRDPEERRSDLHAILSLHSSAKTAAESVGNKGIGFRSVFAFGPEVEVWSRTCDEEWWGIRLRHPAATTPLVSGAWSADEVASFYAPELLSGDPDEAGHLVTVVRVPGISLEKGRRVREAIADLAVRPLAFLERRARFRDGRLQVVLDDGKTVTTRQVSISAGHAHAERVGILVPEEVKRRTGLELSHADVRVLVPPAGEGGEAVYWSYLPTERLAGHGAHVHADFYLQSSRRDVAFRMVAGDTPPDDPNGWNGWLLREGAALIVDGLWRDPRVVDREDFWRLAAPGGANCGFLRLAVGIRLLGIRGRFRELVADAFARPPEGGWTVRRYRDFFNAIEGWANFAYNHYRNPAAASLLKITGQRETDWRNHLLAEARLSLARVVPIVEQAGEDATTRVTTAELLPSKGFTKIYLRKTEGFALPGALRRQGTQVTTFSPMPNRDPKDSGLLEFDRPEVLSHVVPGKDEGEHEELIGAVCRLAGEQPTASGGYGSVTMRGPGVQNARPYWRFLATEGAMPAVGRALSRLHVPVAGGGWAEAATVVIDSAWPGAPVLDAVRFEKMARPFWPANLQFDMVSAAALFGIGPVPLGTAGGAPTLELPPGGVGEALLHRWESALGSLVPMFDDLRRVLVEAAWIDDALSPAALDGVLLTGELGAYPFRPLDLWWKDPRRGFRTGLLPLLERRERPAPWMEALGISAVGDGAPDRAIRALRTLQLRPDLLVARPADVESAYTALVRELPEAAGGPDVPVLIRRVGEDGRTRELAWRRDGEEVWFDNGKASHALAAFKGYSLWVVRRGPEKLAKALGLQGFDPGVPLCRTSGSEDHTLRDAFVTAVSRALPDLFAAASHASIQPPFDGDAALRAAGFLRVRHADRAWLEYTFAGRTGTLGEDEGDDVFVVPGDDGSTPWLVFDGDKVQLPPAAGALSDLLCGNRAYVHAFASGLVAWSRAEDDVEPPAVRRFRREHGLADAEVAGWRERLAATRMDSAQRAAWREVAVSRLSAFGEVAVAFVDVDRPVTPASWVAVTQAGVTEATVEGKLHDLVPPPRVLFSPAHRRQFLSVNHTPFIAQAAELRSKHGWTEGLYGELKATGDRAPSGAEEEAFRTLGCDVYSLWRARFGVALDAPAPSVGALAFARGQIPLVALPTPEATPGSLVPWGTGAATIGLAPLQDDEWLKKARKQASGGARAEDAVLAKSIENADFWYREDPGTFASALRAAWAGAWAEARVREAVEAAIATGKLKRALHAASLVGDAGYDLLVPDRDRGRYLKVEVKRVENLENAAFFLSENERRQSLAVGPDWRLWLVAGDGRARDVTWVRASLERAEPPVGEVLALGLRPGEWLVRVT